MNTDLFLFADYVKPDLHDPGGKVRLKLPPGVASTAIFSGCRLYRYRLERAWGSGADRAAIFLMCNPSVASRFEDDPTVAKCRRYAVRWGCGRLIVLNVMAYRVTDPDALVSVKDPVGPANHVTIQSVLMTEPDGLLVCAWGAFAAKYPTLKRHEDAVRAILQTSPLRPHYLRLNQDRSPAHPLYLPGGADPQPWNPGAAPC